MGGSGIRSNKGDDGQQMILADVDSSVRTKSQPDAVPVPPTRPLSSSSLGSHPNSGPAKHRSMQQQPITIDRNHSRRWVVVNANDPPPPRTGFRQLNTMDSVRSVRRCHSAPISPSSLLKADMGGRTQTVSVGVIYLVGIRRS
jgi:hypothetical protein